MNHYSPVVSVVLPFYNAEQTLERALESISCQSLRNFECIMTDNNSPDGSAAIAKWWAEKDSRFRLINESRQGVVHAFNRGAELARGNYLARMDADDEALPDRLRLQSAFLEKHQKYDAVGGMAEYVSHISLSEGFKKYVDWVNSIIDEQQIKAKQFIEMPVINPTMMWRKSFSDKYGLYREGDFPEDYEMWLRWLNLGARITKVSSPVIRWHDYETRLTRTHSVYSEEAFYRIKTKYLAEWLRKNNPFHPEVVVWGASRQSRKKVRLLDQYGIRIKNFIDIKPRRDISHPVIHYSQIQSPGESFILVYVKLKSAKQTIGQYLLEMGYVEGVDFLFVS